MVVTFETLTGRILSMCCTVQQFLDGPIMSHLAAIQNDCDPTDLIRDHLVDDVDHDDDAELAQHFGEACLLAASAEPAYGEPLQFQEVTDVRIEPQDLPMIRRRFFGEYRPALTLMGGWTPVPAA